MSILTARSSGLMLAISMFSSIADAADSVNQPYPSRPRLGGPNSLYEAVGAVNRPMSADGADRVVPTAAGVGLLVESTLSRQVYNTADTNFCQLIPKYSSWYTVFNEPIVTQNLVSTPNVVEVNFNTQVSIAAGGSPTNADAVYLSCTAFYSPGGGSVPCSSTGSFPALLRQGQATNESGHLTMVSYHGYVPVTQNGQTVTIEIKLATGFGTTAQSCFSNLILRTR